MSHPGWAFSNILFYRDLQSSRLINVLIPCRLLALCWRTDVILPHEIFSMLAFWPHGHWFTSTLRRRTFRKPARRPIRCRIDHLTTCWFRARSAKDVRFWIRA